MLAETQIRRSLAQITIDTHRAFHKRATAHHYYDHAERTHQFQFPVSGTLSREPIEKVIKVLFDIKFLFEYGIKRDSQLNEPQSHFGFTSVAAPTGTVLYAHVTQWIQDQDLNFVGAFVAVGAHNPSMATAGTAPITSTAFRATLHCSFQGYGAPLDEDDALSESSSEPSANQHATEHTIGKSPDPNTTTPGANPGKPITPLPGAVPPAKQTRFTVQNYPLPTYSAGPLGGASWTQLSHWDGHTNTLDAWEVIPGEGRLTVDSVRGVLGPKDPYDVTAADPRVKNELKPGFTIPKPFKYGAGDKYAANFIKGGKLGDETKIRMKYLIGYWGPALGDNWVCNHAITFGMKNRHDALAFFFGPGGIGWTTNVNHLGYVRYEAAWAQFIDDQNFPVGVVEHVLSHPPKGAFHGQDQDYMDQLLLRRDANPTSPAAQPGAPQDNSTARAQYDTVTNITGMAYPSLWIELWRDGPFARAAIWKGTDSPDTAVPVYMSQRSLSDAGDYAADRSGYFGFVRGSFEEPNPATIKALKKRGFKPQPQGIESVTTYRKN